jgi:hypothetical protein
MATTRRNAMPIPKWQYHAPPGFLSWYWRWITAQTIGPSISKEARYFLNKVGRSAVVSCVNKGMNYRSLINEEPLDILGENINYLDVQEWLKETKCVSPLLYRLRVWLKERFS